MIKKIALFISLIMITLPLGGCWNYVGLNEITIVAGMAFDKDEENQQVKASFEIVEPAPGSKEGPKSRILESEGKTAFDAVRNARRKVPGKLYFGNTQIYVISEEIAKEEDLLSYLDLLMRDMESRETSNMVVAKGKTAKAVLESKLTEGTINAFQIKLILDKDKNITASTKANQLYQTYNMLNSKGQSLVVPALKIVENDKNPVFQVDGVAVFQKEKVVGYLNAEETKYFLFVDNTIGGGILTYGNSQGGTDNISLEISKNKTQIKFHFEEESIKATVKTDTKVYIGEMRTRSDLRDPEFIDSLEDEISKNLEDKIMAVIKKAQMEYNSDIFGFGSKIHQQNPKLWKQIENDWDSIFPTLDVSVECKVNIVNSAALNKS